MYAAEEKINFDWESNIRTNILMLRVMGLWPRTDSKAYIIYGSFNVLLFTFQVFFQAINIYFIGSDLKAIASNFYTLLIQLLSVFKAYYLLKNLKLLKHIFARLKSKVFQPVTAYQIKLIQEGMFGWKLVYNIFLAISVGSVSFSAIFPLLDESFGEKRLPIMAWYPFDTKKSPGYELAYISQVVGTIYASLIHVNVDLLVGALNVYIGNQFDMLCDNIRNLHRSSDSEVIVNAKLIACILHHKQILRFSKQSNKFFEEILFVQFFISSVAIGITMFQLTLVELFSTEFGFLISYEIAVILQIFMYCWFGNEVEHKSQSISYALFNFDWLELPREFKKNLLIFTLNVHKPTQLSVLNLFYLSIETFMKILKTAWSYFALFNTLTS